MQTQDCGLALRAMGALVNDKEVKKLVLKYDVNKTGKVSFDEYMQMMAEVVDKEDSPELIT